MRLLVLLLLFFLPGCGLQPVYGDFSKNPETAAALSRVAISNVPNREGLRLRNLLIDRMYGKGRPTETDTILEISLRDAFVNLGLQKDSTTTRQEYNLTATYSLKNKAGKILVQGECRSIVSFSKLDAQYATVATRQNAIDRALNEVGEQIVNRLSLYFAEAPQKSPSPP